jgi:hypothetical protein
MRNLQHGLGRKWCSLHQVRPKHLTNSHTCNHPECQHISFISCEGRVVKLRVGEIRSCSGGWGGAH